MITADPLVQLDEHMAQLLDEAESRRYAGVEGGVAVDDFTGFERNQRLIETLQQLRGVIEAATARERIWFGH